MSINHLLLYQKAPIKQKREYTCLMGELEGF